MWLLLLCSEISRCENNAWTYVLTILDGQLSMTITLSCPSNILSHFSQITPNVGYVISEWYSFVMVFISYLAYPYFGDNAMMLPQHLTCVSEFKEVLSLYKNQGSWRVVRCNWICSSNFTFSIIFQFWHF